MSFAREIAPAFALSMVLLQPVAAGAGVTLQTVETVSLTAGALCGHRPDDTLAAPQAKGGKVGLDHNPYHFVLESDDVPALRDVAVGIVVRLEAYQPDEVLTLQAGRVQAGVVPDTWQTTLHEDGSFWVASNPDPGTRLEFGIYRFAAFRGDQAILTYEFVLRPPTAAELALMLCAPAVS